MNVVKFNSCFKKLPYFRFLQVFITLIFLYNGQLSAQLIKLEVSESEKIKSEFINNVNPKSISAFGNGNILLNWTKYLGDSTINRKRLILKDGSDQKWYQAEAPFPEKELILESESVFDSKGNIHILTGSRNEKLISGKSTNYSELSYFTFADNKWTNPEKVFSKECKNTSDGFNKVKIYIDRNDQPVILLVNSAGTTYSQKLILYKKINGVWNNINEIANLPYNFSFFIDRSNVYHVAFIKYVFSNPDSNGIYYSFSKDGGKNFSQPLFVKRFGKLNANDISMSVSNNSVIHVAFSKVNRKNSYPEAVYHCSSKDGFKWSDTVKINVNVDGVNINPCIVSDSKNRLHAVWEWSPQLFKVPSKILYSRYTNNKWSPPVILFDNATAPSMSIDENDTIHILCKDLSRSKENIYSLLYTRTTKPVTKTN